MTSPTTSAAAGRIPAFDNVTLEGMKQWFIEMAERGLLFHPDDAPAEIIHGANCDRTFTDEECATLEPIMARMFAEFGNDIHEAALSAADGPDRDTDDAADKAPMAVADIDRLRELCVGAGIRLVQSPDEETTGRWDWRCRNEGSDQSFEFERDAALDALESKFGEDWQHQVGNGDTRRSFLEFVGSENEMAADETDNDIEGAMRP